MSEFFARVGSIPKCGIASIRLVFPNGLVQHDGISLSRGFPRLENYNADTDYLEPEAPLRECDAVSGALVAVRQKCWSDVGGFDEDLVNNLNDVDLCLRARDAKWMVLVDQSRSAVHFELGSRRRSTHRVRDVLRFSARWSGTLRSMSDHGQLKFRDRLWLRVVVAMGVLCRVAALKQARGSR